MNNLIDHGPSTVGTNVYYLNGVQPIPALRPRYSPIETKSEPDYDFRTSPN